MTYQAPVDDIMFALKTAADMPRLIADGLYPGLDEDTVRAVVEEAGKLAAEVLDPLNRVGDRQGSRLVDGTVATPPGWKEAYDRFVAGGWSALPCRRSTAARACPRSCRWRRARSGTPPTCRSGSARC